MHKLKEIYIEEQNTRKALGAQLTAEIFGKRKGSLIARISGDIIPIAPVKIPGEPIPNYIPKAYGPVEIASESEQDFLKKVKKRIEKDIGRVIRMEDR